MRFSEGGHLGRVIVCAAGLCLLCAACASGMGDKLAGQPCTRSDQCADKLVCSGGSCVAITSDAGNPDSGPDDDAGTKGVVGK